MLFNLPSITLWALALSHTAAHSVTTFYKGHDLSSVKFLEDSGYTFKDTARKNITRPLENIMGDGGMNSVRLRIWVNPPTGDYGLEYTLELASRLYTQGYEIYLDFHFSDNWADPEKQIAPAAWPTTLPALSAALRTYVKNTLVSFKDAGIDLAVVSLGNEITHGMLWPLGRASVDIEPSERKANFTPLATLLSSARKGVDDAVSAGVSKPEVMLHLSFGWNYTLQSLFYESLTSTGKINSSEWDSFGISFYPWNGLNATYTNLRRTLTTLSKQYSKPVHVAETDFPVACSALNNTADRSVLSLTPSGQLDWVRRVENIVRGVPNGLGRGIWYWEPGFVHEPAAGSPCDDVVLFDTDKTNPSAPVAYSRSSVEMFLP